MKRTCLAPAIAFLLLLGCNSQEPLPTSQESHTTFAIVNVSTCFERSSHPWIVSLHSLKNTLFRGLPEVTRRRLVEIENLHDQLDILSNPELSLYTEKLAFLGRLRECLLKDEEWRHVTETYRVGVQRAVNLIIDVTGQLNMSRRIPLVYVRTPVVDDFTAELRFENNFAVELGRVPKEIIDITKEVLEALNRAK